MSRKNEKAKTLLTIVQQCEEWESWDKMAKEMGLQSEVRARAKYTVNYRHKNKYPVSVMCRRCPELASVLLYIVWRCRSKDAALAELIAEEQERSFRTHGYRGICPALARRLSA